MHPETRLISPLSDARNQTLRSSLNKMSPREKTDHPGFFPPSLSPSTLLLSMPWPHVFIKMPVAAAGLLLYALYVTSLRDAIRINRTVKYDLRHDD